MYINKRATNVPKKVFLAVNVNNVLANSLTTKYKDLRNLTFSCTIGSIFIERALLNLGTRVNLLLYSMYQQLGLGELKPTGLTLQLADRSIKVSKGKVEDVLIKIGDFIFLMDFVVLETEPIKNYWR